MLLTMAQITTSTNIGLLYLIIPLKIFKIFWISFIIVLFTIQFLTLKVFISSYYHNINQLMIIGP